jgi:hypothetical protein
MTPSACATAIVDATSSKDTRAPSPADNRSIADLLNAWKVAHLAYRQATQRRDKTAAAEALNNAAIARARAELADPTHTDPIWQENAGTHSLGSQTHDELNADLLQFYTERLEIANANG